MFVLVVVLFVEEGWVPVVEDSSENTSKGGSTHVHGEIVCHYTHGAVTLPCLEEGDAECEGWVEWGTGEVVDRAETPEDKADSGDAPYAHIGTNGVLASGVEDEKNEDEGADDFHIEGGPGFA